MATDERIEKLAKEFLALGCGLEEALVIIHQAKIGVWRKEMSAPFDLLFEKQMKTLEKVFCPKEKIRALTKKKRKVIDMAMAIKSGSDLSVPFVPVIPRLEYSPEEFMAMVRVNGRKGRNYIKFDDLDDVFNTPDTPYFIFGVEFGSEKTLGKSPKDVADFIKKRKLSALTLDETVGLCTHTEVLSEHAVYCLGTTYGERVLEISIMEAHPSLSWCRNDRSLVGRDSPYCILQRV